MAEFIRLLDSSGTTVLDSVSTSYEDSFGLESFGELIQEYMIADPQGTKSFIIARVQTWDHKQPDRAFYSYYNAHHLNKILFQTQLYLKRKLIHRLHVLNPLTNSDIIGNVLYFKVVNRAAGDGFLKEGTTVGPTVGKNGIIGSAVVNESSTPRKLSTTDQKTNVDRGRHRKPSNPIAEEETGQIPCWTFSSPAVSEVTEEEGNLNAKMPFPHRKFSLIPLGVSPLPNISFRVDPRAKFHVTKSPTEKFERQRSSSFSHHPRPPVDVAALELDEKAAPTFEIRRTVSYECKSKPASGPITLNQRTRAKIPAGTVTQFSVPVPKSRLANMAPSTPKGRRRSLSYANALAAGGQRGTMREWVNMIHDEQEKEEAPGAHSPPVVCVEDFDSVPPFGLSRHDGEVNAVRAKAFISHISSTSKLLETAETDETSVETGLDASNAQTVIEEVSGALPFGSYDAILVGTDNDFLESSNTRNLFKANAIKPEDGVLFEMPKFTGDQGSDANPATIILEERVRCDWCYLTPEQLAQSNCGMRFFHAWKCYFAAVLLALGILFFVFLNITPIRARSGR